MFCCGNSKMRWPLECESLLCFFGICFPLCVGTLWEGFKTFCNGNFIDESEDNLEVRPFYPGKFQNLLPYKPIPAEQDYYVGRVQQLSISEDAVTPAAVVLSSPKQGDTWQRKKYASTNLYYDDGVPAANGISASRGDAEDEAEDGYQFYQELFSAPGSSPVREGEGAQRSLPYYASFPTYEKRHDLSPPTFNAHSEIRIAERQEHSAGVKLSKEVLVLLGKMSQTLVPLEDRGKLHSPISLPSSAEKSTAAASSATPPRRRRANIPEVQKLDSTLENYDTSEPVTGELEEKRGRNSSEEGSESNQLGASQGMDSSLKDTETLRFFVSVKPRGEESGVETSFAITRAGKKQKKHLKRSAKEEREAEDGNRQRHETGNLETSVLQGQDSTIRGEEPQYGKEAVKIVPKGYAEVRPHSSLAEDEEFGRTALEGSSFLEEDKKTKVEKRLVSAAAGQTEASFAIDSSAYHLMQTQNFLNKYAVTGTEEERSYLARVALVRLAQAAAHQAATSAQTAAAAAPAAAARAAVRGDVAPVIAERAAGGAATPEEELEAIAELEAGTSLFTKVQGLPIDILEAIIATPRDPYSLIRCANGFVAISTSLCAFSMDEELPIKGSCLGAAAFDIELARCFTVSEVEPVASCPIGYRIARMPLDYQYGPCRPAERIPVAPSCDPPFVFDPAVARCLYNSTHAGYLGCPPASISVNETACATASQVLKKVTCPENFEALLTKEGEAECRKTLKGRGNYSASPRCPGNAEELINYELYDEDNKPIVTCVSTQILRGSAVCPASTVPYYTYLREKRQPPVITDTSLGAPARTCVKVQEGQIRPSCYDMEKQVPFVLLIGKKEEEKQPINFNMVVPNALVEALIKPEWTKFKKDPQDDNEGNPLYRREEDIAVRVLCLSFHYAQPVLRCPDGFVRGGLNLQECRRKAFVDFVLTCPPGYYLNELSLVFGMYHMPRPKCIGKLPAATQYFCPVVKHTRLATKRTERVVYLKDVQRKKCIKATVSRPLWTPSKDTIDAIFPGKICHTRR